MPEKLIASIRTSNRKLSLGIALPRKVSEKLNASESDPIGIYEIRGKIVVRKIE